MTCPYCVQWYCTTHEIDDEDCPDVGCVFEPRWADGTVATITQQTPCEPCATTLAQMQEDRT
jgi:hypothetical protein